MADPTGKATVPAYQSAPDLAIDLDGDYTAILHTNHGDVTISFFPAEAPLAVNNFLFLAGDNPRRAQQLAETLMQQGIEVYRARRPIRAAAIPGARDLRGRSLAAEELPIGTYVVNLDQPMSPLETPEFWLAWQATARSRSLATEV